MRVLHNKFVVMCRSICILLCCLFFVEGTSQITFTRAFTKKLERAKMKFVEPVELWLHAYPLRRDEYMKYDLVLQNDRNDFEMRFRIRYANDPSWQIPQNIEASRLLASLAANAPDSEIRFELPPGEFWRRYFNADGGTIGHFTPKSSYSDKRYGALISILSFDNAVVDVIILYNDETYRPMEAFRNIWFE